jgi:ABC-type Fe3+/spermidine/putrescine transport system ATPase subunit
MMAFLEVTGLTKQYPDGWALSGIDLRLERGHTLAVLGPSGCGKSTLLRLVAGLELPNSGTIRCDGEDVSGVPPYRRGFGLMFQDYALFPHLTVAQNVAFGLRMMNWPRARQAARVDEMLALVSLPGYGPRPVYHLSGGEQQRVALARSLAPSPRLLMLDEPLGALDAALRKDLLNELRQIIGRLGVTTIYVTHDQDEALAIAETIILMRAGRVAQSGAAEDLVERPASPFVAAFLGLGALLPGVARLVDAGWQVETGIGTLTVAADTCADEGPVTVLIRPAAPRPAGEGEALNRVSGTAMSHSLRADGKWLHLRLETSLLATSDAGRAPLEINCPWPWALPQPGARIAVDLDPREMTLLPASG